MKLPKADSLILVAFLVCTALWGISKCNERRDTSVRQVRDLEDADSPAKPERDTSAQRGVSQAPSKQPPPTNIPVETPQTSAPAPQPGVAPRKPSHVNPSVSTAPTGNTGTTLYVSIDGLKVRKEPGLKGETVVELRLYEPVTFLNQKTDWTQEISLGYEKVTDHWVKIRTQSGYEGWVFGAGLHYYKTKRQGVLESTNPKKKTNR